MVREGNDRNRGSVDRCTFLIVIVVVVAVGRFAVEGLA